MKKPRVVTLTVEQVDELKELVAVEKEVVSDAFRRFPGDWTHPRSQTLLKKAHFLDSIGKALCRATVKKGA